jgi:hypothetical protein
MRTMYDWSSVPADPHLDVSAFYIGGDTPHVATASEIASQSARWRLPIYTCDNPGSRNPTNDANSAVAWLRSHSVPLGCTLALDYELAVDASYLNAFDSVVVAAGYKTMVYGSLSYVTQNPRPSGGYWTADWTAAPHLNSGAMATQYISDVQLNKSYDLSVVSDSLVLWDTQGVTLNWTDVISGPNDRPGGNSVSNILTDIGRFRDVFVGDATALAAYPAGSPMRQLLALVGSDIVSKIDGLTAPITPTIDYTALVNAMAANTAFVDAVAHAFLVALKGALPAS